MESRKIADTEFDKCGFDDVLTAECIKYNLVKNNRWSIPVFTKEQYEKFVALIKTISEPLSREVYPLVESVYDIMRRSIPKHLHEQIKGVFGAEINSVIAMICDVLEENARLERPQEDPFTGQIMLVLQ